MVIFEIALLVLITLVGGLLLALAIAWLAWTMFRWTRYPGIGPILAFALLAARLHSSDFTQMVLLFSGLCALGAFATLFVADPKGGRNGYAARQRSDRRMVTTFVKHAAASTDGTSNSR